MLLKQTPQIRPLYQVPATHRGRNLAGTAVARKEDLRYMQAEVDPALFRLGRRFRDFLGGADYSP